MFLGLADGEIILRVAVPSISFCQTGTLRKEMLET